MYSLFIMYMYICVSIFQDFFAGTTDLTSLLIEDRITPNENPQAFPTAGLYVYFALIRIN